jgi:transcriptional regulator with XRE-family HTH domain
MALHFLEHSTMVSTLRKTLRTREHRKLVAILVAAREEAGLNQRELAARLKRPRVFVGRNEAGERRIDVIEFIAIARVMGVDPRQLFAKLLD